MNTNSTIIRSFVILVLMTMSICAFAQRLFTTSSINMEYGDLEGEQEVLKKLGADCCAYINAEYENGFFISTSNDTLVFFKYKTPYNGAKVCVSIDRISSVKINEKTKASILDILNLVQSTASPQNRHSTTCVLPFYFSYKGAYALTWPTEMDDTIIHLVDLCDKMCEAIRQQKSDKIALLTHELDSVGKQYRNLLELRVNQEFIENGPCFLQIDTIDSYLYSIAEFCDSPDMSLSKNVDNCSNILKSFTEYLLEDMPGTGELYIYLTVSRNKNITNDYYEPGRLEMSILEKDFTPEKLIEKYQSLKQNSWSP